MRNIHSCPESAFPRAGRILLPASRRWVGWLLAIYFLGMLIGCYPKVHAQDSGSTTDEELQVRDTTFDDLKFEMEKGDKFDRSMLTEKINQVDGQKIRLRGFIRPAYKQAGISKFVFVRDNQECCFGPGAALYDCVLVEMAADKSTDYTVRPISVVGDFFVKEFKGVDGNLWAIYRMKNALVE